MTVEQYIAKRRYWEFALFALVIIVFFLANLSVEVIDGARQDVDFDYRGPLILEATSHIAMAIAIPLLLLFERRFPFRARNWRTSLASYVAFSVVFSLVHVTLMYWGRVLIFRLGDATRTYHWDNWFGDFSYEYLKDFRAYIFILAMVYMYRFILLRLQGEAGFLSEEIHEWTSKTRKEHKAWFQFCEELNRFCQKTLLTIKFNKNDKPRIFSSFLFVLR